MGHSWSHRPKQTGSMAGSTSDPYAEWAILTHWAGVAREGRPGREVAAAGSPMPPLDVRILAEAETGAQVAWIKAASKPGGLVLSEHNLQQLDSLPACFTATVPRGGLGTKGKAPPAIEWELAAPQRNATEAMPGSSHGYYGPTRDAGEFRPAPLFKVQVDPVPRGSISGPVMAVIDFGCPILHEAFTKVGNPLETRIAAFWDQGSEADAARGYACPKRFGYGRELGHNQINTMLAQMHGKGIAEHDAYASLDHLRALDDPRRRVYRATHGAHVLDVAGGKVDPLTGDSDTVSKANLIFVQLPSLTAADSSGGSLGAYLLDAVNYIVDVCDDKARIVVNISYGSFAGPHDGSSLIERALDDVVDRSKGRLSLVLAAGNAREAGCHVRRLVHPQRSALLRMNVAADDPTDTFVELWYVPQAGVTLSARVRRFGQAWSDWAAPGERLLLTEKAPRDAVAMLLHGTGRTASSRQLRLQGTGPSAPSRQLLLLALRPTAQPADDDGPLLPPGHWEIELALRHAGSSSPKVAIDAWIERDDPGGFRGLQQSSFIGLDHTDDAETLSSLATGGRTIVVGGFRVSDGKPASYSSVGTVAGKPRPLVYAACEWSEEEPGILAAAVCASDSFRMNGTSVAAPALARRLLRLMHAQQQPSDLAQPWLKELLDYAGQGTDPLVRLAP